MAQKYAILVVKEYVATLQPKLSGKYHHDSTEIKDDHDDGDGNDGEDRYFGKL